MGGGRRRFEARGAAYVGRQDTRVELEAHAELVDQVEALQQPVLPEARGMWQRTYILFSPRQESAVPSERGLFGWKDFPFEVPH